MNTKYLKFMFFLLVYLLIGTQAYAESIDVGSHTAILRGLLFLILKLL